MWPLLFHPKSLSETATYIQKTHHLKQECPTPTLPNRFIKKNRESTLIALWCMSLLLSFPSSLPPPFLSWTLCLCFIYMLLYQCLFCTCCFLCPSIWFTWLILIHLLRFNTSIISLLKLFWILLLWECLVLCLPR